jgi:hypothetical protein
MSSYYSQQEKTWPYFARCIYSGNEKIYDVHKKNLSDEERNQLNFRFMKESCQCDHCKEWRQDRAKLIKKLREMKDTAALKKLGEEY